MYTIPNSTSKFVYIFCLVYTAKIRLILWIFQWKQTLEKKYTVSSLLSENGDYFWLLLLWKYQPKYSPMRKVYVEACIPTNIIIIWSAVTSIHLSNLSLSHLEYKFICPSSR